ncbi:hypothetical protein N7468_009987 [Penicillium chermesinum]|uniref:Rhodopsin domain-containing protein n=1 Tax=Penicillium chermesinum TaxID=63820 RepID=A0A9W9TC39_9EURO|nr:uncharacterized protein N7468_009987 [Penicillium chermesinum]KAJ5216979.1 hypothetical protein N7468_009987 [Penicillium chermesinum]
MGPYVPPGQSPPFEVVDDFHHGAWIIITAALGLVVSLACLLIRLYVRLMLIPPFARDDMILLGATAFGIIQSILVFYTCSRGFGTSIFLIDGSRVGQIQALIATSDTFSLVVIYLSKCCVVAIYLRLTPQKLHNLASWATAVLCTAWVVPAIFILLVNCELNKPWRTQGGQCRHLYQRWQFIAIIDILTELCLFILAVVLLKGLFMSVKRKIGIGLAFIFRFPLIAFTILHLSTLSTALNDEDVTLAAVEPTLWLQVEVHYALVACSVFCLRPFMAAVSTNYGTAGDSNLESSGSRSRATKDSSGSTSPVWGRCPGSEGKEQGLFLETPAERIPMRRSIFPLCAPERREPMVGGRARKGDRGLNSGLMDDPDAIELVSQSRRRGDMQSHDMVVEEDVHTMAIRKEVGYSIQYEYDEGQGCREGRLKTTALADADMH